MQERCRVEEETRDHLEDEARGEEMNRFERDFRQHVAKPIQRSKAETRAHYEGELEKLHQQWLEALIACQMRRPELPLDSIVGQVNWELDSNICDEAIEKFKEDCGHG